MRQNVLKPPVMILAIGKFWGFGFLALGGVHFFGCLFFVHLSACRLAWCGFGAGRGCGLLVGVLGVVVGCIVFVFW